MKFEIIDITFPVIPAGKTNAGHTYLLMEVCALSPFAQRSHKRTVFVPQPRVQQWKDWKAANKLPQFSGHYEIVENLPPFKAANSKEVQTSMRVLIEDDDDGNPTESGRKVAMDILHNMAGMTLLPTNAAPFEATENVNPAVVAAPAAKTQAQIDALLATGMTLEQINSLPF